MSFLTQNITAVRLAKSSLDRAGTAWASNNFLKSPKINRAFTITGEKYIRLYITAMHWKTVIVEINDSIFCICLSLKNIFDYKVEPLYTKEHYVPLYNRSPKETEFYNKYFRVSNLEEFTAVLTSYEEKSAEYTKALKDISYIFSTGLRSSSVSTSFVNKHFDINNMLYLPLACFADIGGEYYDSYLLLNDIYFYSQRKRVEELKNFSVDKSYVNSIVRTSDFVGLNNLKINFNNSFYKLK